MIFTGKELKEQIRSWKGVVILILLMIFGMTSPLTAKLTPDIIRLAAPDYSIKLPTPTYLDSYAQFFKNIGQMALIVIILVFASGIVSETTKGTAQLMLTKRLSRNSFILSKFFSDSIVWTVSYAVSAGLCFCYTIYLFPVGKPSHLFLSMVCLWLFGVLMISASVLSSTLFPNYAIAAVGGFGIWAILALVSGIPKIKDYAPTVLCGNNIELIGGSISTDTIRIPLLITLLLILIFLLSSCLVFRKREL